MIKYYVYIVKKTGGHAVVPLNTKSLEETDNYIADNFLNHEELERYILKNTKAKVKTYNPYAYIKQVKKTSEFQETERFYPTYARLDKREILMISRDVIINRDRREYRFLQDEIRKISKIINKEKIEYEDIRECYFILLQLGIKKDRLIFVEGTQLEFPEIRREKCKTLKPF